MSNDIFKLNPSIIKKLSDLYKRKFTSILKEHFKKGHVYNEPYYKNVLIRSKKKKTYRTKKVEIFGCMKYVSNGGLITYFDENIELSEKHKFDESMEYYNLFSIFVKHITYSSWFKDDQFRLLHCGFDECTFEYHDNGRVFLTWSKPFENFHLLINEYTNKYTNNKDRILIDKLIILSKSYQDTLNNEIKIHKQEQKEQNQEKNKIKKKTLLTKINNLVKEFDTNNNGLVDFTESNSFQKLVEKNQSKIIKIDPRFIQKLTKISVFLESRSQIINNIFFQTIQTKSIKKFNKTKDILSELIESYNIIQVHSLNMIVSLIDEDLITFYRIYEVFDNLNIFDSKWEKDLLNKLNSVDKNITLLNQNVSLVNENLNFIEESINKTKEVIYQGFNNFSYDINNLNDSVNEKLLKVNSQLSYNNLLTTVNTYQLYTLNKKTSKLTQKLID